MAVQTLGIWLAPIIGSVILVIGIPRGLRWHSHRRLAMRRIAERLAWEDSHARGYPDEYDQYLEHYLGGQHWQGEGASDGKPGTRRPLRRWRGGGAA